MTPFDRSVRAHIYRLLVAGVAAIDATVVAEAGGWDPAEVLRSFEDLASEHRIALGQDGTIWMAHPFSGVPTLYRAVIGDRFWFANCAWDSLAILAVLGDGEAQGEGGMVWKVDDGVVSPNGLVHLLVPARDFWNDIGFT